MVAGFHRQEAEAARQLGALPAMAQHQFHSILLVKAATWPTHPDTSRPHPLVEVG